MGSIYDFDKVKANGVDMLTIISTMYANQLWIMQSLNIILEDMKE